MTAGRRFSNGSVDKLRIQNPGERPYKQLINGMVQETLIWVALKMGRNGWVCCTRSEYLGILPNQDATALSISLLTLRIYIDEMDQQYLERRYARSALAAAYLIPEGSVEALQGVHTILSRIIALLDLDRVPTLEASGALLISVGGLDKLFSRKDAAFLRSGLLDEQNPMTTAREATLKFLHAVLISAYLMTKEGTPMTARRAAELALRQDEADQNAEFDHIVLLDDGRGIRGDSKFWTRRRNEVLWLRNWGAEELAEDVDTRYGNGIFGKVSRQVIEVAILKGLLRSNCWYSHSVPLVHQADQF